VDTRVTEYARANASIGINGTVLNNVNANAKSLSPEYLKKTVAMANVFRRYGIRVYLSARFSAPIELGGLKTADPLDPEVIGWWKKKADETMPRSRLEASRSKQTVKGSQGLVPTIEAT
jgi:alpha-glucuronidase